MGSSQHLIPFGYLEVPLPPACFLVWRALWNRPAPFRGRPPRMREAGLKICKASLRNCDLACVAVGLASKMLKYYDIFDAKFWTTAFCCKKSLNIKAKIVSNLDTVTEHWWLVLFCRPVLKRSSSPQREAPNSVYSVTRLQLTATFSLSMINRKLN